MSMILHGLSDIYGNIADYELTHNKCYRKWYRCVKNSPSAEGGKGDATQYNGIRWGGEGMIYESFKEAED